MDWGDMDWGEAAQVEVGAAIPRWLRQAMNDGRVNPADGNRASPVRADIGVMVKTAEGDILVERGDWIIRDSDGVLSVRKSGEATDASPR